jgi:hypothetical protein
MSDLHYFHPSWVEKSSDVLSADVCVYGGTSAGLMAAVAARRQGHSVLLLHPGKQVGGLTSGGLGWTDYGQKGVIGGLAREFYRRVGRHYGKPEEFMFEPHVASAAFADLLKEHDVSPRLCQYLDRVQLDADRRITELLFLGGLRARAKVFIDATYEGDLMKLAGVSHAVGREPNTTYRETLNGIQVRPYHQFSHPVSPFVTENDPASGLLPNIVAEDLSTRQGEGDTRVQAYCFRMCMTDDPALKIPWEKPDGYDPLQYVLAGRWFRSEKDAKNEPLPKPGSTVPRKFDVLPNLTPGGFHKTDTNNHSAVSSDFIGANWDWPDGCYERREEIFQAHVTYQKGLYWYLANSPDVPDRYRAAYSRWGLAKDEFIDTGHWPHSLYVREARRMVSDYVMTEHNCMGRAVAEDPVAMASYTMDSHNCSRFVRQTPAGPRVLNDGDVQVRTPSPFPLSFRSIVPKRGECPNLLVPVCLSSSHIAYGSARMEPVFMALAQSAATAASLALTGGNAVQDVAYPALRQRLEDAGQVLSAKH